MENFEYSNLKVEKLDLEKRLRLKGLKIDRWSYVIFKIDLKYEVDHSYVTIYNINHGTKNNNNSKDNFKELNVFSGYYSPEKANDHRIWSLLSFVLCGLIFMIILGTLFV